MRSPGRTAVTLPDSPALRELLRTIADALSIPPPATSKDEMTYLRTSRNRARCVIRACQEALGRERDEKGLAAVAENLQDQLADYPADEYDPNPLAW
jgi:hypothetical protein